jgi:hypothetical protein
MITRCFLFCFHIPEVLLRHLVLDDRGESRKKTKNQKTKKNPNLFTQKPQTLTTRPVSLTVPDHRAG